MFVILRAMFLFRRLEREDGGHRRPHFFMLDLSRDFLFISATPLHR